MKISPFVTKIRSPITLKRAKSNVPRLNASSKIASFFPCWFGSALKLDGVKELFKRSFEMYTEIPEYPEGFFGAKVFKNRTR